MLTPEERERYRRQMTLEGFTEESQMKLKKSTVLVAGIGGLGGTAALYLAAAGLGRLILVHDGNLTISNLNRQVLMSRDWVGRSRVERARRTLKEFNPDLEVEILDGLVEEVTILPLLERSDLAIDCRHNFEERRTLNRCSLETTTPLFEAAMNSMECTLFLVKPDGGACLNCLYPEDPEWDPYGFSVLGAVSGALGCITAVESVKLLTGFQESLKDRMLHMDLGSLTMRRLRIQKREDCAVCNQTKN